MAEHIFQIEEALEERFLFENDSDSLHILLSIIDNKHKYLNFQTRFILMKQISSSLKRFLRARKDRNYVLHAIKRMINDDVNRFEMAIVLKAYAAGMRASEPVDRLERLALKMFTAQELEKKNILFHEADKGEVMGLQSHVFFNMKNETNNYHDLKKFSSLFAKKLLRKKILRLNSSLDAQIVMDFDSLSRLKTEESCLNMKELNEIYHRLNRYLYNNVSKVYKYAYWRGINDAVLERYGQ